MLISVFIRAVLYGCWKTIDWREVRSEGKCGRDSYVPMFKMASNISFFRREVDEDSALLGYYTASSGDGRIILRWILRKWEGVVGTGWSWLRIGAGGGRL